MKQEINALKGQARPTATLIAKIKRQAKVAAKTTGELHTVALDRLATESGWPSWHALHNAYSQAQQPNAQSGDLVELDLPVDPKLPRNFDDTPNEERSRDIIKKWWDRPYAISQPDGKLLVRCLDGGAWDRSTNYGVASTLQEAKALATRKLAQWQRMRAQPVCYMDQSIQVVQMPQSPLDGMKVLYTATDNQDAARFIDEYRAANSGPSESDQLRRP